MTVLNKINTKFIVWIFIIIILLLILTGISLIVYNFLFKREKWDKVDFVQPSQKFNNIPIFIINLEKHKDRKEHMIKLLNKLNWTNYKFITPVSKEEAVNNPIVNKYKLKDGSPASHCLTMYNILSYCVKNNYEEFVIMEDDIEIFSSNINKIDKIYNDVKKYNFDLLFLEYCSDNCRKQIKLTEELDKLHDPWCSACTLYTKNGASKILENFHLLPKDKRTYDYLTSYLCKNKIINCLGSKIFKQDPKFGSSISTSFRFLNLDHRYCY